MPVILDVLAAAGTRHRRAPTATRPTTSSAPCAPRRTTDPVEVVSGDRDLMQVVRDEPTPVRLLYVGRGLAKAEILGPPEVAAKYGVPADRAGEAYAEMAMLRGDPSDGLPGVPGIGAKTAATLVGRFGSWAELRAAVDDRADTRLSPPVRTKLAAAGPYLAVVEPVVRVALDAPVRLGPARPACRRPRWTPRGWPSWRSGGRWAARWSGWSRRWRRRDASGRRRSRPHTSSGAREPPASGRRPSEERRARGRR